MGDATQNIVLALDLNKFNSEYIKSAAKIANNIMATNLCIGVFNDHFSINSDMKEKMFEKVDIKFEYFHANEIQAYSWATRGNESVHLIKVNKIFLDRLNHVDCNEEEKQIIITLISICIVHEVSHLIMRWKGFLNTPHKYEEAGVYIEKCLFIGKVCGLIHKNNENELWDSSKRFTGLALDYCDCEGISCIKKKRHYKKWDANYVVEFYTKGLSTGLKSSFPVVKSGSINETYEFPLKSNIHEKIFDPVNICPEECFILPRNCPIELERKRLQHQNQDN